MVGCEGKEKLGGFRIPGRPGQAIRDRTSLESQTQAFVNDQKAGIELRFCGMCAQDLGRQAVDRADPCGIHPRLDLEPPRLLVSPRGRGQIAYRLANAIAHFAGRLFGEGDGGYLAFGFTRRK